MNPYSRTELLLGSDAMQKLKNATVAVFGLGGVGGYVVEARARSGVGALELIDHDTISLTNINRQILATRSTVGQGKAETAKMRVLDIDPNIRVTARTVFYGPDTAAEFDFTKYDFVVDAIETVSGKIAIIEKAHKAGVPVISAMGAGNKLDNTAFEVADISKTSVCPLARVMRRELKKRGIEHVKVVYSKEEPKKQTAKEGEKSSPSSIAFVPSVAGLIVAGEVIKDLINNTNEK